MRKAGIIGGMGPASTLDYYSGIIDGYRAAKNDGSYPSLTLESVNMAEMLATRDAHEELTTEVAGFLKGEGFETFTLSTESCDLCEHCAYLDGKPCRFPEKMHPCLESHGVVVNELVEHHSMEYNLGGNTILWFSLVLFRQRA